MHGPQFYGEQSSRYRVPSFIIYHDRLRPGVVHPRIRHHFQSKDVFSNSVVHLLARGIGNDTVRGVLALCSMDGGGKMTKYSCHSTDNTSESRVAAAVVANQTNKINVSDLLVSYLRLDC